jgi:acyl-CoA thioesterase I
LNNKRRVLIIGDSVSMPRPEVSYEDTWICRLKNEFPHFDIIDKSERGTTSFRLVTEGGSGVDLLETYMPGTVILQFGITECAPRLFNKKGLEFFIVSRILTTGLREKYIRSVKKNRVRNPDLTDVSPEEYYNNLNSYFLRAEKISAQVLVIPIIRPSELFVSKSPHIAENIEWYNTIMKKVAGLYSAVSVVEIFDEDFNINTVSLDELHIDKEGHKMIYERISEHFKGS